MNRKSQPVTLGLSLSAGRPSCVNPLLANGYLSIAAVHRSQTAPNVPARKSHSNDDSPRSKYLAGIATLAASCTGHNAAPSTMLISPVPAVYLQCAALFRIRVAAGRHNDNGDGRNRMQIGPQLHQQQTSQEVNKQTDQRRSDRVNEWRVR